MFFLLAACAATDTLLLEDRHNYALDSSLTLVPVEVREGSELTLDWCSTSEDLLGLALDPATATRVEITKWDMDLTTLEGTLLASTPSQQDLGGQADADLDGACRIQASELTFLGNPLVPADWLLDDGASYLATVYDGHQAKLTQAFQPRADATDETLWFDGEHTLVAFEVDLDRGEPATPAAWVDWSSLTTDAAAYPLAINKLESLRIMRFDESLETLEADFVGLETLIDQEWRYNTEALLELELGDPDLWTVDGTWLLAMACPTCINPAPPFLTVVEVE